MNGGFGGGGGGDLRGKQRGKHSRAASVFVWPDACLHFAAQVNQAFVLSAAAFGDRANWPSNFFLRASLGDVRVCAVF